MRVLVTGGAGAVGSNLVRALLDDGLDVVVLDDLSSGYRELVPEDADFIAGSITDDEALERAFEPVPDYVFHMAALFANQNSVEHPVDDLLINGLGTQNVLEMSRARGVKKVVFNSSSCVYGNKIVMLESDREFDLDTPYAITKLLGEHYCTFWSREHGLDTVTVRIFNSYGPNEYPGRYRNVIPNFIASALKGEPLRITGSGEETRDFTYVSDIVSGLVAVMRVDTTPGDVFNLGSGTETRIIDLAHRINRLTGNGAGVAFEPRRHWDHVSRRRANIDKGRSALGYEPRVGLDEGLEMTYDWLKRAHA